MGSRCLLVILVSGKRRLPVPPARTMPFINVNDNREGGEERVQEFKKARSQEGRRSTMGCMNHYDWNGMASEQLNPHITRKAIHCGNMTIARLELKKDGVVPEHHHVHEQVATVERGALRFTVGGVVQVVRA